MTAPTSSRLPPLSTLRVFDAVARLDSLKEAAEELRLTPSAVSHQLRNLEEHLGVSLLRRRSRGVELTEAGVQFAAHIATAFREIHHAVRTVRQDKESSVLRVSTAPVFATELIMPNLHDFERRYPAIQLRLEMSETQTDFDTESIDAAIRLGPATPTSLYTEELLDISSISLFCSPKLMEGPNALREIGDLQRYALVSLSNQPSLSSMWRQWVHAADRVGLKPARELRFDTFIGALQAAESGLGLVLAPHSLVARQLQEGRLAMPFKIFTPLPWAYRFMCRRGQERLAKVDAFRRWIGDVTHSHRKLVAALA
jgi:LysR family transcriptional regulator, glycine cleavage system transcriptional activator